MYPLPVYCLACNIKLLNIITVLSVECRYPKIIVSSSILGNSMDVIFCHQVASLFQNLKAL